MSISEKRRKSLSKFLSFVLRHRPERLGLDLDAGGWVDVDALLRAAAEHGRRITKDELDEVVALNDKQRFAVRASRIRANQGHSIDVDLGLEPVTPPDLLFHGTAKRFVASIRAQGLLGMGRRHVHLSSDPATARSVGKRHGDPVVLRILAADMHVAGHAFYRSENGVWLTRHVPWTFAEMDEVE